MGIRDRPPGYCAYLLRCWSEPGKGSGPPTWRFSLEDPHTGERRGFGGLEALVTFLQSEVIGGPEPCIPPPTIPTEA